MRFENKNIDFVYFIGIGGIGMSALALYFKRMGLDVRGYDRVPSRVTDMLQSKGIEVYFDEDETHLTRFDKDRLLVVYTPAIPDEHKELSMARRDGYFLKKRSEVLGVLSQKYKTIAIGGTHGKTTVTSMVAHVFKSAGKKAVVFSGGIMANYDTNFLYEDDAEYMIVEADEYDRSFLQLKENFINVVTAVDADHLDIYSTYDELKSTFVKFASSLSEDGVALVNAKVKDFFAGIDRKVTYGVGMGDFYAENVEYKNGRFELWRDGEKLTQISLNVRGRHNVENAVAAASVAYLSGIETSKIANALNTFKGNWRRFEVIFSGKGKVYIDDYAHHPEEIKAVLDSVRQIWQGAKVLVVFQPHLYSRTRDLARGFAEVLAMADDLVLLPIYPAREKPIEGITSAWLLDMVELEKKHLVEKAELVDFVEKADFDVLLTLGAGDIDRLVKPLAEMLKQKYS